VKRRVVLIENEQIVRQGLRRLLELDTDLEVVGEACDGEEAIDVVAQIRPDVVLLDLRMPRRDGIGVLEALRLRGLHVPCVILTTFDDPEALLRAVRAGAKGWLLKDAPLEELVAAISEVAAGGTYLQPALTSGLMRGFEALGADSDGMETEALTDREHEVLRLMAGGYANKEIAVALGVAERTIKNHVSSVLAKLGVRDRTRAVLKALERRLL
jgi:DNA-binding NarL/FixJ family response regulator